MDLSDSTVFIVDDDPTTCRYYQAFLAVHRIASRISNSAREFLDAYNAALPGCVLLDVRLPTMSGPALQQHLNRAGAVIPVIFITAYATIPMCVEAMNDGAFGFLEKPVPENVLLQNVRAAFEYDLATRKRLRARESIAQRFRSLTPRENEVMFNLLSGGTNKALAADMNLSPRTIELHRARIMDKLGTRSLAQLARMAIDTGFAPTA